MSPKNETLRKRRSEVIPAGQVSAAGFYVAKAAGALIYDVEGREYVDFAGGIAVMNVGHSHPRVVAAIKDQTEKFTHTCFMVAPYEPAVTLAEKLAALAPGDFQKSVLFINSGAEAVENAVKIARYATGRQAVIALDHAFHGRTLLGMTLTGKVKPYKFGFGPFAPEVYRIPSAYCYRCPFHMTYPGCGLACAEYLREFLLTRAAPESVAAVIAEPIQGEGGFITPPPEYFGRLKMICEEHGILFIADEIQTGIGRTGTMFALDHWNVTADVTTLAKSLAAGLPLSAVVARKDLMDAIHAGGLGGTYGGNPLACRAALAVLEVFETENLLEKAAALGEKLKSRLNRLHERYEMVGDVRGIGPMLAMELVKDRERKTPAPDEAKALVSFCYERGLILLSCGTYGNVIRFLMPLVITDELLDRGLAVVEEGLRELKA